MDDETLWETYTPSGAPGALHNTRGHGVLTVPESYYLDAHKLAPAFVSEPLAGQGYAGRIPNSADAAVGSTAASNLLLATESLSFGARMSPSGRTGAPTAVRAVADKHGTVWELPHYQPGSMRVSGSAGNLPQLGSKASRHGNSFSGGVSGSGPSGGGKASKGVLFDDKVTTLGRPELRPTIFQRPTDGGSWSRRPILRAPAQDASQPPGQPPSQRANAMEADGSVSNKPRAHLTLPVQPSSPGMADATSTGVGPAAGAAAGPDAAAQGAPTSAGGPGSDDLGLGELDQLVARCGASKLQPSLMGYRRARTEGAVGARGSLESPPGGPGASSGSGARMQLTSGRSAGPALRSISPGPTGASPRSRLSGCLPADAHVPGSGWKPNAAWKQEVESKVAAWARAHPASEQGLGPGQLQGSRGPAASLYPAGGSGGAQSLKASVMRGSQKLQQLQLSMSAPGMAMAAEDTEVEGSSPSSFGLVGRSNAALPMRRPSPPQIALLQAQQQAAYDTVADCSMAGAELDTIPRRTESSVPQLPKLPL